ncbi:MAG: hypothetical protein KAG43_02700 [Candidatus Marithrix sp.]|nr:hypothetical protein [Candidatus Marithrix sp.]
MYKHHPTLVLGFHACEHKIGEEILGGEKGFKVSENDFDWLGSGMYFWENSPSRAKSYGIELKEKRNKLNNPMVIGAVIHLGRCFDLLEYHCLEVLQEHYLSLKKLYSTANKPMPTNETAFIGDSDKLYRKLDCAVIEYMHSEIDTPFDTIRGVFWEGEELYPGAGFKEKNHIQLCVRNPNCIKGYFRPLELNSQYPNI